MEWCYANPKSKVFDPNMLSKRLQQAKTKRITAPQYLVEAAATKRTAAEMKNWSYYTTNTLNLLPHLYTDEERVELMESVFEQQTHAHSHVMVMHHQTDGHYLF